jgi:hypothetical protein
MLSLDERERRATERAMAMKAGKPPGVSARGSQSGSARGEPMESPSRGIPKPGESLFDNYAQLQDPTQFSTDEEEVQDLLRMGVGFTRTEADERHLEAGWDPSPHKNPPAYLKAIKPITREPWTIDAQVYNRAFDTGDFGKPTRYGVDLFNMGTPAHEEKQTRRPKGAKKAWDSSTFRQVPYSLRGIKPASTATEPWVKDQANRKGDFEDNDVIENATAVELDNGGEGGFKKGAFRAYKEERNRKLHADAWDSSTRTW